MIPGPGIERSVDPESSSIELESEASYQISGLKESGPAKELGQLPVRCRLFCSERDQIPGAEAELGVRTLPFNPELYPICAMVRSWECRAWLDQRDAPFCSKPCLYCVAVSGA